MKPVRHLWYRRIMGGRMLRYMMLVACVLGTLLASVAVTRPARCSPLDCEGIRDHDQRHYCRAVTTKKSIYCESIRNSDLRHRCRAEVKR